MHDWFDEHGQHPRNPWADSDAPRPADDAAAPPPDSFSPGHAWDQAEHLADLAHRHYEAGLWSQALDALRRALTVRPEQAEWQFGLGLTLDALGRYEQAADAFGRVIELRGEEPITCLHLGITRLRAHQPRRAIEALQCALAQDPDFEPAHCQLILAHTLLGEHEQAELHFYLARQLTERCPACFDHLARSLMIRRDLPRAIWCWHEAQRLDADYPEVGRNLARAYHRAGSFERALALYTDELRREPGDIELLLESADLLRELGRDAEAGEKLRRVIELEPEQAAALLRLGELALEADQLDTAADYFAAARATEPAMPGIHLGLALLAEARDQPDLARAQALAELDREGQSPIQVVQLAALLLRLGEAEQVVELLTPLICGDDPMLMDEPSAYLAALLTRALAWLRLGRTPAGIADLRRLLRIDPDHATATAWLIDAYRRAGRRTRAAAIRRQARERFPHDPRFHRLARPRLCV